MVKTFHQKNAEKNATSTPIVSDDTAFFTPKTFHSKNTAIMDNANTNQPKALFEPSVQATIDDQGLALINEAIVRLDLDDHAFNQAELNKALLLKNTIRVEYE